MPNVPANVQLHKGWYEKSLPEFIQTHMSDQSKIALLNMDSDTFTPTKYVLLSLRSFFRVGTIIIFDDFLSYPGWINGEYAAMVAAFDSSGVKYKYIGYSERQVAIEIINPV